MDELFKSFDEFKNYQKHEQEQDKLSYIKELENKSNLTIPQAERDFYNFSDNNEEQNESSIFKDSFFKKSTLFSRYLTYLLSVILLLSLNNVGFSNDSSLSSLFAFVLSSISRFSLKSFSDSILILSVIDLFLENFSMSDSCKGI